MKKRKHWNIWKFDDGKKVPFQSCNPSRFAKPDDPRTWSSYEDAREAAPSRGGIGFNIKGSGIGALDLDDCRNPETGELDAWAERLVERAGTYCEVTPSGEGLRIIGYADGSAVHCQRRMGKGKVEIYRDTARYITVTGDELGKCKKLTDINGLIDELPSGAGQTKKTEDVAIEPCDDDWRDICKRRGAIGLRPDIINTVAEGKRSDVIWKIAMSLRSKGATPGEVAAVLRQAKCWRDKHGNNIKVLNREVARAFAAPMSDAASRPPLKERLKASAADTWPRPMSDAAYHGLTGQVVKLILPNTEADPANLLMGFLTAFGNSVGRSPYVRVGATRHHTNEFVVMVGPTSEGRKGTGWDQIYNLFRKVDEASLTNDGWTHCIKHGMSTGEGLIAQMVPPKSDEDHEAPVTVDTRMMVIESEFARTLTVMQRPDNTLSSIIRAAWETGHLSVMTRKDPLEVKDAHLSMIGQITDDELRKHLNVVERANGFGNRFLFAMVRRSKSLPFGGDQIDFRKIIGALTEAREFGSKAKEVKWGGAMDIWPEHYDRLTAPKFGMLASLATRAAPHVLRLAAIYALLDKSDRINEPHLLAALEVWRYCEDSAKHIFGATIGDDTSDAILDALKHYPDGLTRTEISTDVFSRNKSSGDIKRALDLLVREGLAERELISTGHRPREVWRAIID